MPPALSVLEKTFGYSSFRGQQAEIIQTVVDGGDALVLMPTGGGKSLCYQVPALCLDGLTVVVSPLIALMQDQVSALTQLGVRAAMLNSTLDFRTTTAVERAMLFIAADEPRVELFARGTKGAWVSTFVTGLDAEVPLGALELTLPMAELYAGADLDAAAA